MSKRESIARYNLIIKMLRKHPATFEEITDYLSLESELQEYNYTISKRTFQRDLEDIRSLYNIYIQYDFSRKVYYLEFDDERSGGFEPLRFVSDHKKVVLGLVTSKSPILEEKEVIKKRIAKAAKYIPLDRLYLSPQCGFASCEIGNKLTEEEQWAKLALVKEIAKEVWG